MDQPSNRTLISQLAEDIGWLEDHCRKQPEQVAQAGHLRLAAALVRNCIGPFLDGQAPPPLHLAVVGGAGAGKSTVANLLTGAPAAEANPQAGFTRHPIAYTSADGALTWSGYLGFLGPLQRLSEASPSSLDADVYQVRRVPVNGEGFSLLPKFVVWDCPDMTTWAATDYVSRLLEIAGLADVIVYVASDERYNDEVPTQFLSLLLQTGKPVVACLMKMREADAPALLAHFQSEVLSRMPAPVVACLAIPYLPTEQLANPSALAGRYRIPLLNQVAVIGEPPGAVRHRCVRWGMNYLLTNKELLVGVARQDLAAMENWRSVVQMGRVEFEDRYRREYLTNAKFRRFDEALVRLLDLLEIPVAGRFVSKTLWVLRTPYRLIREGISKALARPEAPNLPELPVLERALAGWIDLLRKEAAHRAATHPLWQHVEKGFERGLTDQIQENFQQGFRAFQTGLSTEVDRTARAIFEELEKNPPLLNTLRGGKLAVDVAAILGAVVAGGTTLWHDFILVPLAASITHQLVELLGWQYVDAQRDQARNRQQALVAQYLSGPLAEWLIEWPATGGSAYERLQLALRRIPTALAQLESAVNLTLMDKEK